MIVFTTPIKRNIINNSNNNNDNNNNNNANDNNDNNNKKCKVMSQVNLLISYEINILYTYFFFTIFLISLHRKFLI